MLFIKGVLIGLGKIIPGVSGSLIAITLGEYENMINSLNSFFKDTKSNFLYLFKICFGIILSIILFSNIIIKSINVFYIYTMFIFAGFILGSNDNIKNNSTIKIRTIIISFIAFFIVNKYLIINIFENNNNFIYFFIGGIIDSITMVIPGISGTAILISYGCYYDVINSISILNIIVLFPFLMGCVIGLLIMIKIIIILFNKYKNKLYNVILGISYYSIINMIILGLNNNNGFISIIVSNILFVLSYLLSKKMIALLTIK